MENYQNSVMPQPPTLKEDQARYDIEVKGNKQ